MQRVAVLWHAATTFHTAFLLVCHVRNIGLLFSLRMTATSLS